MILKKILLSILFVTSSIVLAQDDDKVMRITDVYEKISESVESPALHKRLGDYYYFNNNLIKAKKWYNKLDQLSNGVEVEYYYRHAQVLKSLGEYEKSDKLMQTFRTKSDSIALKKVGETFDQYSMFQSGRFLVNSETKLNASRYSELSPSFYNGDLLYSSTKKQKKIKTHKGLSLNTLTLYLALIDNKNNESKILSTKKQKRLIKHKISENSPVITRDGNTMYITKTICEKNKRDCVLNIFKLKREKNSWGKLINLSINSKKYSVAHPTLDPDEKYLYFTSNKDSKNNTTDIFVSEINNDGSLSEPKKVQGINTSKHESYPFLASNGELYFSSNGHFGLGGFDIFVAKLTSSTTIEGVYNLGAPINSKYDDISFIINSDTRKGYFSSNRQQEESSSKRLKKDDIYSFIETKPLVNDCNIDITGVITDKLTKQPIVDATVLLIDNKNNSLEETKVNKDGTYKFSSVSCNDSYFVRAYKAEYTTTEKFIAKSILVGTAISISNIEMNREGINLNVPIGKNANFTGMDVISSNFLTGKYDLSPIYFNYASNSLTSKSKQILDKIAEQLLENIGQRIEIRSYTDIRGTKNRNLKLSERRALTTFDYLVFKGINPLRISLKCLGEQQPVNDCVNKDCTEEQHRKNRRSEFTVLK